MTDTVRRIEDHARWRKPAVIAASIVLHAAVLGLLALNATGIDMRFGPDAPDVILIPVELEPRPLRPGESARVRAAPLPADRPTATQDLPGASASQASRPVPVPPEDDEDDTSLGRIAVAPSAPTANPSSDGSWRVQPSPGDGRGFVAASPLTCRNLAALSPADRAVCEDRFATAAARAAPIIGTGDNARDARFAAEGAFALAEYDRRRAPLTPNSRARPCPHTTDIMGRCPVQVIIPLFSSQKGFLPGLKKDD